ncbi:hypothetical protein KG091_04585 [Carnobacteriaceae bacterium zg-ZUI78]|nr:hypothetical protein [Carnobacteriaceae bacterium zg-ZUI78]
MQIVLNEVETRKFWEEQTDRLLDRIALMVEQTVKKQFNEMIVPDIELNKKEICEQVFRESYKSCQKKYFCQPSFPQKNIRTGKWSKKEVMKWRDKMKKNAS